MNEKNERFERAYRLMMKDNTRPIVAEMSGVGERTIQNGRHLRTTPAPATCDRIVDAMKKFGYIDINARTVDILPRRIRGEVLTKSTPRPRNTVSYGNEMAELWILWIKKGLTTAKIVGDLANSGNTHTRDQAQIVVQEFSR